MAISTYAELKTAVANWTARTDLTAVIPDFITLAATRIYYGSRDPAMPSDPVRIVEMQGRENPTLSSGTFSLPTRYLETIRIRADNGGHYWTMDYVSPAAFADAEDSTDDASIYTILNGQVHYRGTIGTITHDYYARFADFSADGDTNALLTNAPGVWLHGACIEVGIYTSDDALSARSYRMYLAALAGINRTLGKGVMSSLAMRAR